MSEAPAWIREMVRKSYREEDVNCATAMLRVLARSRGMELHPQVFAAATGMHGAGCYGAQCGLVEGGLMFLGILGREKGLSVAGIEAWCRAFAAGFEDGFGSLSCSVLRPQGFAPGQPPHMCEDLSVRAVSWAVDWVGGRSGSIGEPEA
jgi:hypothetical protein